MRFEFTYVPEDFQELSQLQFARPSTGTRALRSSELQQPHTADANGDGVQLSNLTASTRWVWAAFDGWRETPTLFVLRRTDGGTFLVIPKRGTAGGQQLDEMRTVLQSHVGQATGGFPVVTAGREETRSGH